MKRAGRASHRRFQVYSRAFVVCCLLLVGVCAVSAQTYGFRASYESGGTRVLQPFRMWVPPNVPHLRGAVFLWAGAGQDWRDRAGWEAFQHAAEALGFALVGTYDNELGLNRAEVDTALERITTAAAEASGRPELANAPVALMGFSQGGYRSTLAAALSSGRVLGVVGHKGAQWVDLTASGKSVPALFIAGALDANFTPEFVRQAFQQWRNQGGGAAYAIDWNVGHDDQGNQGWEAAWYWLAEVVRLRYPEGSLPSTTPGTPFVLDDIPLETGWLADKARFRSDGTPFITNPFFHIAPYDAYNGSKSAASWLPSLGAAFMYRAFTSTDEANREEVPFQTPLRIRTPAAFDTVRAGTPLTVEIDTRGFGESPPLREMLVYEDSTLLGAAAPGAPWTATYTPTQRGIHVISAVATDNVGAQRTTFRTLVVLPSQTTIAADATPPALEGLVLRPGYPNPFRHTATIPYTLTTPALVHADVVDVLGRVVATLLNAHVQPGDHTLRFDAAGLPGGLYMYRLTAGGVTQTRALLLLR